MKLLKEKIKGRKYFLLLFLLIIFIGIYIARDFLHAHPPSSLGFLTLLLIIFSIYLGLTNFSDKIKLSDRDSQTFFWNNYFSGLIILLVYQFLMLYNFLYLLKYTPSTYTAYTESTYTAYTEMVYSIFLFFLSGISTYTIATFTSLLTKKFILNLVYFPFVFALVVAISIPLYSAFTLSDFSNLIITFIFLNGFLLYLSFTLWNGHIKNISVRKNVIVSIFIFCIFSFSSNGLSRFIMNIKVKNVVEECRRIGIKTDLKEVIPLTIPDEKNASLLYNEIFKIMEEMSKKEKEKSFYAWDLILKGEKDLKKEEIEKGKEEIKILKKIIESDECKNIFKLVEKAVNMPCRFNVEYEKGVQAVVLPHLDKLRKLARYICAKIYFCLKDRKYDEAIKFTKIGLKISDSLKDEPILVSQSMRLAIDNIIMKQGINLILNERNVKISENEYKEILAILDKKEIDMKKILNGEMLILATIFSNLDTYLSFSFSPIYSSYWSKKFFKIIDGEFWPIVKNEYVSYLIHFSNIIEFSDKPYYLTKGEIKNLEENINNYLENLTGKVYIFIRPKYIYSILPPPRFFIQKEKYSAYLDTLKIAIGLKIYKQKYGKYPEKLDSLIPEILPSLPCDPFTGKGFIYRTEKDGFLIYSLGENEKDDNGILDPKTNKDDIGWKLEI